MKVLVTGASGFIGRGLCLHLEKRGYGVIPSGRNHRVFSSDENLIRKEIGPATDWSAILTETDFIVHLASAPGRGNNLTDKQIQHLWMTNVEGAVNLAVQAAAAKIKRFIYLSTVKVHGEQSHCRPFRENDRPEPLGPYSRSKLKAELKLRTISGQNGLEMVIIRPPLVYGPGVKGNFLRILSWINKGLPLPLAAIDNRRSLIGLDNLLDFITLCLEHPGAGNNTFLVSDGEDLSTPEIIRRTAFHMKKKCRIFPVPRCLLEYSGFLLGRGRQVTSLCTSLQVDSARAMETLSWSAPFSVDEGLKKTVSWYLNHA
ncbi:MAG: NAD-dependent epimerase/dehydratase family protein [Desulfonatronovibrio sp.]